MSREYVQIKRTIWTDPDFRALSVGAQHLYFLMLTHPSITFCGVIDWREARLSALTAGQDVHSLRQAASELSGAGFIVVDEDTEEALVCSFVRHDGALKSPNVTRSLVKDYAGIASVRIMRRVSSEVRRVFEEHPDWKGRDACREVCQQFPEPDPNPIRTRSEPDRNPSGNLIGTRSEPFGEPDPNPSGNPSDSVPGTLRNPLPYPVPVPTTSKDVVLGGVASAPPDASADAAAQTPKPTKPKPKTTRGTRLPDDWTPTTDQLAMAAAEGVIDPVREAAKFADYWRGVSGTKGVKRDWDATWRNWVRRAGDDQRNRRGHRNQQQIMDDMRAKYAPPPGQPEQTALAGGSALQLIAGGAL